jgi:hypothetical protein
MGGGKWVKRLEDEDDSFRGLFFGLLFGQFLNLRRAFASSNYLTLQSLFFEPLPPFFAYFLRPTEESGGRRTFHPVAGVLVANNMSRYL